VNQSKFITEIGINVPSILNIVRKLLDALNAQNIAYCHWKSNINLDRALNGDDDLDILVLCSDAEKFTAILNKLCFKEAKTQRGQNIPLVSHYYGFDNVSSKLVHVHVYYGLILGRDVTKNFHVSIEQPFIENAIRSEHLRIAAPEFEFIVFVIRMVLKFSVTDTFFGSRMSLSNTARRELEYLQSKIESSRLEEVLNQYFPGVNVRFFDECLRSLQLNSTFWYRLRIRIRLQSALKLFARRSPVADAILGVARHITEIVQRRIFGISSGKRIARGGKVIALVGGDGSGKSSAVNELYRWLQGTFDVLKVHMGRPPRSWSTVCIEMLLGLYRRLQGFLPVRGSVHGEDSTRYSSFAKYLWLLRCVSVARDRHRLYTMARTFAAQGGIVISDRYPIPNLKRMDGPQAAQIVGLNRNRIVEFLTRLEAKYYQVMLPSDVLIVLKVCPDIAVQRKVDEDPMSVRERSQEIWEMDWRNTNAHIVDASLSKLQVNRDIKSLVWSYL
jgi:thymidylate kinase